VGTVYNDHDLAVFLEGAGVAEPEVHSACLFLSMALQPFARAEVMHYPPT
jgi:hypothetical protein